MQSVHDVVALDVLLETRSVSAAAARLGVTQSAMSHTLARLRDRFQDPLLVRSGRALVPTARAEEIAPRLRAAIRDLSAAVEAGPTFDPANSTRTFRIGTTDLVALVLLPKLMPRVARAAPNVDLLLRDQTGASDAVLAGDLDLAVLLLRADHAPAGLKARALFHERFVCLMRRGHPLAGKLTLDAYVAADHALISPAGGRGGVVDTQLEARGLSRRTALLLPSFLVVPHVVASTDLIVTLPEQVALAFAPLLALHVEATPIPLPGFTMSLVWHERNDHEPGLTWLREQMREAAEEGR
jgi:DNA-binding transcriptional LysR family regulator